MKELTSADFSLLWPELRRWLPVHVTDVWMIGSASVVVVNPDVPAALRTSKDIDVIPVGTPALYFDSTIMERELGEDSDFSSKHRFFVDYVSDSLLKWTPPGWQQRVTTLQLTDGLRGHCLDPHDIAYNKLYAGRPKDIIWVRGLLGTGIIGRGWRNCTPAIRWLLRTGKKWSAAWRKSGRKPERAILASGPGT